MKNKEPLVELEEQARLLAMSASREATLLGKIERLERENAALTAKVYSLQDKLIGMLEGTGV